MVGEMAEYKELCVVGVGKGFPLSFSPSFLLVAALERTLSLTAEVVDD